MSIGFPTQPVYLASANIRPARVLVRSATVARSCAEGTGATLKPIGIAANRYKYAPGSFEQQAIPYLAQVDDAVDYIGPGREAYAISGAAITNLTKPLVCDSTGRVITATIPSVGAAVQYTVGSPLEAVAAADQLIKIQVEFAQYIGDDA